MNSSGSPSANLKGDSQQNGNHQIFGPLTTITTATTPLTLAAKPFTIPQMPQATVPLVHCTTNTNQPPIRLIIRSGKVVNKTLEQTSTATTGHQTSAPSTSSSFGYAQALNAPPPATIESKNAIAEIDKILDKLSAKDTQKNTPATNSNFGTATTSNGGFNQVLSTIRNLPSTSSFSGTYNTKPFGQIPGTTGTASNSANQNIVPSTSSDALIHKIFNDLFEDTPATPTNNFHDQQINIAQTNPTQQTETHHNLKQMVQKAAVPEIPKPRQRIVVNKTRNGNRKQVGLIVVPANSRPNGPSAAALKKILDDLLEGAPVDTAKDITPKMETPMPITIAALATRSTLNMLSTNLIKTQNSFNQTLQQNSLLGVPYTNGQRNFRAAGASDPTFGLIPTTVAPHQVNTPSTSLLTGIGNTLPLNQHPMATAAFPYSITPISSLTTKKTKYDQNYDNLTVSDLYDNMFLNATSPPIVNNNVNGLHNTNHLNHAIAGQSPASKIANGSIHPNFIMDYIDLTSDDFLQTDFNTPKRKLPIPQTTSSNLFTIENDVFGQTENQYLELLQLENSGGIVPNSEPFDCPICFVTFEEGTGVTLRDCLHKFCKVCLTQTITHAEENDIKCPNIDGDSACDAFLQDREIRALLTKCEYEKYLMKTLRFAENNIENTIHCKQPDCIGFAIIEDELNTFHCPSCKRINCIPCAVSKFVLLNCWMPNLNE